MKKCWAVWDAIRDAVFLAEIDTGMILAANPPGRHLFGNKPCEEVRS